MPFVTGIFVGFIFGLVLAALGLHAAVFVLPILGAVLGLWVMFTYRDTSRSSTLEETLRRDRARWGKK